MGYFVDKDYSLVIQGDNKPELRYLKEVVDTSSQKFSTTCKGKYFLPSNLLYGLVSAEEMQKNGVEIGVLDNQMIYPNYGVWAPTSQE